MLLHISINLLVCSIIPNRLGFLVLEPFTMFDSSISLRISLSGWRFSLSLAIHLDLVWFPALEVVAFLPELFQRCRCLVLLVFKGLELAKIAFVSWNLYSDLLIRGRFH